MDWRRGRMRKNRKMMRMARNWKSRKLWRKLMSRMTMNRKWRIKQWRRSERAQLNGSKRGRGEAVRRRARI